MSPRPHAHAVVIATLPLSRTESGHFGRHHDERVLQRNCGCVERHIPLFL
jgi:hypothetical protein